MCWDCFKRYTDAPVVNERSVNVYRMIEKAAGDPDSSNLLHIIVADMNVEDKQFDLTGEFDYGADNAAWLLRTYDLAEPWERGIFDALAELTEEERATAVAMHWGYIREDGELRTDLGGTWDGDRKPFLDYRAAPTGEPERYLRTSPAGIPFLGPEPEKFGRVFVNVSYPASIITAHDEPYVEQPGDIALADYQTAIASGGITYRD